MSVPIRFYVIFSLLFILPPCVAEAAVTDAERDAAVSVCIAKADLKDRVSCYDTLCPFDRPCAQALVTAATRAKGPQAAIDLLTELMGRDRYDVTSDGHDLAHVIGRATERTFGGTWQSYQRCPVDYFLGCQHGFFEAMLADAPDAASAAHEICRDAKRDQRSFCFHGMGHGLLMSTAYDVQRALDACDQLKGDVALQGCYTGVFMENVNAAERGQARSGVFLKDDPLAPCNRLAKKYSTACYAQHADWLLATLSGSFPAAIRACDAIPDEDDRLACVRHLGQNMATVDSQMRFGAGTGTNLAVGAKKLCDGFEERDREICYDGATNNFLLYDQAENAVDFCRVSGWSPCWDIVADYAVRSTFPPEKKDATCSALPSSFARFACHHVTLVFLWPYVWPSALLLFFGSLLWRLRATGRQ